MHRKIKYLPAKISCPHWTHFLASRRGPFVSQAHPLTAWLSLTLFSIRVLPKLLQPQESKLPQIHLLVPRGSRTLRSQALVRTPGKVRMSVSSLCMDLDPDLLLSSPWVFLRLYCWHTSCFPISLPPFLPFLP